MREQLCASVLCVWTCSRSLSFKERVNNWGTQRMCKPKLVGVDWPHSDRLLIDGCQEYGSHWQDESIPQVYEYTWPLSCNNAFPAIGHLSLYSVAALKYFAINNIHPPTCFSRLLTRLLKNIETKKPLNFWVYESLSILWPTNGQLASS